jgi:hypothetical protein
MANEDFLKVMFSDVTFDYPRLDQTYRYNTAEKRSEPCKPTAPNAAWTIQFTLDAAKAGEIYKTCKAHFEARNPNKEFGGIFGMKKKEDGTYSFTVKRKGTNGQGEENKPPTVIDGAKQNIEDRSFWSGTIGTVRAWAVAVTDPEGKSGISLFFDAVQVTEAVYGGGGLDDFGEVAAPKNDDPFGDPAPTAPAAPKPEPRSSIDDEIPF